LHFQRLDPHCYAVRHRSSCCQALWLTDQAAFTKEFVRAKERDDGLLALLGHYRNFDFALFDIEDGISGIALCKNVLPFWCVVMARPLAAVAKKIAGSNRRLPALGLPSVSIFAMQYSSPIAAANLCKIAHFVRNDR
jgi:hypothetical protein